MDNDKKKTVFSKTVIVIIVVVIVAAIGTAVFWVHNNSKSSAQSAVTEVHSNPHSVPTFRHGGAEAINTDDTLANEHIIQSNNPETHSQSTLDHLMTEEHKNMQTSSYNPVQNTLVNDLEQQNEYSHNQRQSKNFEDVNTPLKPAHDRIFPLYDVNMLVLTESELTKQKDELISALESGQLELWLAKLKPKKIYENKSSFELAFLKYDFTHPQYTDALSAYLDSKINFEEIKEDGDKKEQAHEQLIKKKKDWEAKKTRMLKKITYEVYWQHKHFEINKTIHNESLEKLEICIRTYYNIENESKNVLDNAFEKLKNAINWTSCDYPPHKWACKQLVQYKNCRDKLKASNKKKEYEIMSQKVDEAQEEFYNILSDTTAGISKKIYEYKENIKTGAV